MAEETVEITEGEYEGLRKRRARRMKKALEDRSDDADELLDAGDLDVDASDVEVEL